MVRLGLRENTGSLGCRRKDNSFMGVQKAGRNKSRLRYVLIHYCDFSHSIVPVFLFKFPGYAHASPPDLMGRRFLEFFLERS